MKFILTVMIHSYNELVNRTIQIVNQSAEIHMSLWCLQLFCWVVCLFPFNISLVLHRRRCMGNSQFPHWRCTQRDWLLSLREFQSRLSALADSFSFQKSDSAPRAVPFSSSQGHVGKMDDSLSLVASDAEELSWLCDWPLACSPFQATPDPERTRSSSISW